MANINCTTCMPFNLVVGPCARPSPRVATLLFVLFWHHVHQAGRNTNLDDLPKNHRWRAKVRAHHERAEAGRGLNPLRRRAPRALKSPASNLDNVDQSELRKCARVDEWLETPPSPEKERLLREAVGWVAILGLVGCLAGLTRGSRSPASRRT